MFAVAVAVALGGCVRSNAIQCDDGRTCPSGTVCAGAWCATQQQLDACIEHDELSGCEVAGVAGFCQSGVCIAARCGDDIVTAPEECDGRALPMTDCFELGYYEHVPLSCAADCTYDVRGCARSCGDGVVDPEEQCDAAPGVAVSTCAAHGFYDGTDVSCSSACIYDFTGCSRRCGDGVADPEELCDGGPPPGSCVDFGYDAGRLGCSAACGLGFTGCLRIGWPRMFTASGSWWRAVWGAPTGELFLGRATGQVAVIANGIVTEWNTQAGSIVGFWGASATNVFAVDGYNGAVWHFDGTAWTMVVAGGGSFSNSDLVSIHGTAANNIYAVGEGAHGFTDPTPYPYRLLHYDGVTWSTDSTGVGPLNGVWASTSGDAWAVGDGGLILHRTSSGWASEPSGTAEQIVSIWGSSDNDIYAVTYSQVLHRTASGWAPLLSVSTQLSAVWGRAADDVYVAGGSETDGSLVLHYDGTTWWKLDTNAARRLETVGGTATLTVVGGSDDTALSYAGASWSRSTIAGNRVFAASDRTLVAAAGTAVSRRGLTDWTPLPTALPAAAAAIWARSSAAIFVASPTTLYQSNGSSWTPLATTASAFHDIWGASATADVWAALADGTVGHWTGATWSVAATGSPVNLQGISGTSASDLFVVGDKTIRHYNGTTWSDMAHPTVAGPLTSVWAIAANDVWVAGANGTLLHYNGATWTTADSGTTANLSAIAAGGAKDVWAVGPRGTIIHYDGVAWSAIRSPVGSATISDVAVRSNAVVIATANQLVTLVRNASW